MSAKSLPSNFSVAPGDPNPSPQQLLEHAEETIRLLREKGMRVEDENVRLREIIDSFPGAPAGSRYYDWIVSVREALDA